MNNIEQDKPWKWSKEAMYYKKLTDKKVACELCPHGCILKPGGVGICRTRVNYDGTLYTIAYGNPCAVHIDPIEKKPLYHFLPQQKIYSIATAGCNFRCLNCQNWSISQTSPLNTQNIELFPNDVIKETIENKCKMIAYTYTEPIAFFEYTYDTSVLAKKHNIKNVLISNGYINPEPLKELANYIDAANIDLKCFDDDICLNLTKGSYKHVLETLKILRDKGVWIEITNLIVPTYTDKLNNIETMCNWLVENGFAEYPIHFSRFSPMYKLTHLPPTPIATLEKAIEIARKVGLKYVYIGNIPFHEAEKTYCPACKKIVIDRKGYSVDLSKLKDGKCSYCGKQIKGVWN